MRSKKFDLNQALSVGWVSLNKAAVILDMAYPTIQRLRKQGRIKTIRVGGTIRVYTDEIKRILREGTEDVVAKPIYDLPPETPKPPEELDAIPVAIPLEEGEPNEA